MVVFSFPSRSHDTLWTVMTLANDWMKRTLASLAIHVREEHATTPVMWLSSYTLSEACKCLDCALQNSTGGIPSGLPSNSGAACVLLFQCSRWALTRGSIELKIIQESTTRLLSQQAMPFLSWQLRHWTGQSGIHVLGAGKSLWSLRIYGKSDEHLLTRFKYLITLK